MATGTTMFQFYCPNGHLLQGQASQMGQQSQCPMCGAMFMVPVMNGGPAAPPAQPAAPPPQQKQPEQAPKKQPPAKPPEQPKPLQAKVYHIPCPNGHVLETPDDILGQQALCPYCNVQFELRMEDSQEHRVEQEALRRQREAEMNERWVRYSIRLAIGVGIMFLLMVIWSLVIKSLFADQFKDASPIWGVLGCAVLATLITFVISRQMNKKRAAKEVV
ncbi:MAG: hypothetical protein JNM18_25255 [Planctomycetaceae bacterium]|nr:hypothetical protein [Planctomycetaceae bacterium]